MVRGGLWLQGKHHLLFGRQLGDGIRWGGHCGKDFSHGNGIDNERGFSV